VLLQELGTGTGRWNVFVNRHSKTRGKGMHRKEATAQRTVQQKRFHQGLECAEVDTEREA
jgi:hypothetical protein